MEPDKKERPDENEDEVTLAKSIFDELIGDHDEEEIVDHEECFPTSKQSEL